MNAGLSNLATLKAWLLPAALVASTDYDVKIAALGQGVAGLMERYCNRTFARVADGTYECMANRDHVVLPRYPVESVTSVSLKEEGATDWTALAASVIVNLLPDAGMVMLDVEQGTWRDKLRFTYTGGFWFETAEPAAGGYPTAQPANSVALPTDLQLAWMIQCEHVWKLHDKLGTSIAEKSGGEGTLLGLSLPGLDLIPQVERVLNAYRRLSLS